MKKTIDMINDKNLWAGLNKPELSVDESDVVIFGIPFDGGVSFRSGTSNAPKDIRNITYTIAPTTETFESFENLKVKDLGDYEGDWLNDVENVVSDLVKKGKFFTMLGGDHSTTIPVHRGIDKAIDGNLGIIHIDAHFDLCDDMGGNKLAHGCTERRALELDSVTGVESLYFIGIRSIESEELDFYNQNPVQVISAKEYDAIGTSEVLKRVKSAMSKFDHIYITLDIDALDPAYAAGTGTPQFGGLTSRQLLNLLEGLFELPVIGMDIVEVAANLDDSLASVFAARKIITETWGHVYKRLLK